MTAGTATASPPTVVTSASATPGATAVMLPDPPTAIPMKASMTPSTVPSSPSSGLTDPNVASQGIHRAAVSRSAATSLASTMRNFSEQVYRILIKDNPFLLQNQTGGCISIGINSASF